MHAGHVCTGLVCVGHWQGLLCAGTQHGAMACWTATSTTLPIQLTVPGAWMSFSWPCRHVSCMSCP